MRHALHAFWLRIRNWWVEPKYEEQCFLWWGEKRIPWDWRSREDVITDLMRSRTEHALLGPWWLVRKEEGTKNA